MKVESFNTLAEVVNRQFLFKYFGAKLNESSSGIDLIDHDRKFAIEMKGAHAKNGIDVHDFNFKIGVHQIYDYPIPGYSMFWAFMAFETDKPISMITRDTIEESITKREVLLFDYDYIHTFTAFDDDIFEEKGCGDIVPAFRLLGYPNPYPQVNRKVKETAQQLLFDSEYNPKKTLKVARKDIYCREDRITPIYSKGATILLANGNTDELLEPFFNGPYEVNKQEQLELW